MIRSSVPIIVGVIHLRQMTIEFEYATLSFLGLSLGAYFVHQKLRQSRRSAGYEQMMSMIKVLGILIIIKRTTKRKQIKYII